MKCGDCEYCEYVQFDGYTCNKVNAHISDELVGNDCDCMIYDCLNVYLGVIVDDDGCKTIGVGLVPNVPLSD